MAKVKDIVLFLKQDGYNILIKNILEIHNYFYQELQDIKNLKALKNNIIITDYNNYLRDEESFNNNDNIIICLIPHNLKIQEKRNIYYLKTPFNPKELLELFN